MHAADFFRKTGLLFLFSAAIALPVKADMLELVNGDHYQGTVVSVTQSNVEFQSEMQGRVVLPRDKVARIVLHETVAVKPVVKTNTPVAGASLIMSGANVVPAPTPPTQSDAVLQQMRQQGIDPKLVNQVQTQVLGGGNPDATKKFDELMGGLMSGSLSVQDIRAEAQNSINQIKEAKKDLGDDDAGDMLDGYLMILEKFVQQTDASTSISPAAPSVPAPAAAAESAKPVVQP